ncbi:MAG: hypothetical protein LBC80_10565 [Treponema sp.]|jgi:hypothetical protein|nr:hypothetical protein [Treponema sp.]
MKFKNVFLVFAGFLFLASCVDVGLIDISGNNNSKIDNMDKYAWAYTEYDFFSVAQPLVFGPSTSAASCSVTRGGFPTVVTGLQERVPLGSVELRAIGSNTGGKIAGSEDGIAFYYKRVEIDKVFILEADFTVKQFGTSTEDDLNIRGTIDDETMSIHGQHAFGIMARDHVPQWEGNTFPQIAARLPNLMQTRSSGVANFNYFTGARGGDSNMIMVGGVKQGMRVYWREGIKHAPGNLLRDTVSNLTSDQDPTITSGNPARNEYQDASMCRFGWYPRELSNYSEFLNSNGFPSLPARPDFPAWGSVYRLRLEKNNNGFVYTITAPAEKGVAPVTGIVPLSDIVNSINQDEYYVGFFASREAVVWVSNITYREADASDIAPYVKPDPFKIDASFDVVSPQFYTGERFLYARSNMPGQLVVTQNNTLIPEGVIYSEWIVETENAMAIPYNLFTVPILEPNEGDNHFLFQFFPSTSLPKELAADVRGREQILNSNAVIRRAFILNKRLYQDGEGDIYVNNMGNSRNTGSINSPVDLQTAINFVQPGQTIIVMDGTYTMTAPIVIPRYNNGRFGAVKTLRAQTLPSELYRDLDPDDTSPRYRVTFDFARNQNLEGIGAGLTLAGNYWHLEGFCVENTPNQVQGIIVNGSNNRLSWITTHSNGNSGFQISASASVPKRDWPSYNIIEYCDSFNNRDDAETDADGFAAKLTVGEGNVFLWCMAFNNCDDGWDLFTKKETGTIGIIRLFGCVSYENMRLLNGHVPNAGGQGFKMGGEGISIRHEIHQSIAFGNLGNAFHSNSNPSLRVYNSTAIASDGIAQGNTSITSGDNSPTDGTYATVWNGNASVNQTYNYKNILRTRIVNGVERTNFINRLPDGRPDLGNVYNPAGHSPNGATAFFGAKPQPPASWFLPGVF